MERGASGQLADHRGTRDRKPVLRLVDDDFYDRIAAACRPWAALDAEGQRELCSSRDQDRQVVAAGSTMNTPRPHSSLDYRTPAIYADISQQLSRTGAVA